VVGAAARLDRVPLTIGSWVGEANDTSHESYRQFGFAGLLSRRYVNRRTGEAVSLMLVCGLPGPISVHTPDVCFPGAGYEVLSGRERRSLQLDPTGGTAAFWDLRVEKAGPVIPEILSVYYAWSADGNWRAPEEDARLTFAWEPYLYKIYVVQRAESGATTAATNEAFLRELVPALQTALFSARGGVR
jgi:hypothetical protein